MYISSEKIALIGSLVFIISIVFSMMGTGGAMVYVPIFKWLSLPLKTLAIPLALLLNTVTTFSSFIRYARNGLVDFRGGLPAAASGLIMAPIGAYFIEYIPHNILIIIFAVVVIIASIRILLKSNKENPENMMSPAKRSIIGVSVGGITGFMSGLLGIGGGSIIGPMLMGMGFPTKKAAATTAFVVTFTALSGFVAHLTQSHINLKLATISVIAAIAGSQLGSWFMMNKARPSWIKKLYGIILLVVGLKLIYGIIATA